MSDRRYDISAATDTTGTVNLVFLNIETNVAHEIEDLTFKDVAELFRQLYVAVDQRR